MEKIAFKLNGKPCEVETDSATPLLWVIRTELGLTGTKYGCGIGECGACTVLVNGEAQRSCVMPVADAAGKEVVTIEGLAGLADGELHPLQQAFVEGDALQCGFCTPGMLMNAAALIHADPDLGRDAIIRGMDGNLCRCGAHPRIITAIEKAAARLKGGE